MPKAKFFPLKKNPSLGRYDWKLLLTVLIISLAIAATGGNAISTTIILVLALLISSFCYGCIIYKINSIDQRLLNGQRQITIRAHVSKKIAGYILIFILQWIPTLPRYLYKIYSPDAPTWLFILIIISVNTGGIGNACLYHHQEAFKDITNSSSMEGSDTTNNSTP
nr:13771_t:CDS:2 [Entrophospora candida]